MPQLVVQRMVAGEVGAGEGLVPAAPGEVEVFGAGAGAGRRASHPFSHPRVETGWTSGAPLETLGPVFDAG